MTSSERYSYVIGSKSSVPISKKCDMRTESIFGVICVATVTK